MDDVIEVLPQVMMVMQTSPVNPSSDLNTLLYFTFAGVVTIGIEALRRWVKHRMDIWESKHPIQKDKGDSNDKSSS